MPAILESLLDSSMVVNITGSITANEGFHQMEYGLLAGALNYHGNVLRDVNRYCFSMRKILQRAQKGS